jgi:hypothetical protein
MLQPVLQSRVLSEKKINNGLIQWNRDLKASLKDLNIVTILVTTDGVLIANRVY